MVRAVSINTEARAKSQAAFPDGAVVQHKAGGMPLAVCGWTHKGAVVLQDGNGRIVAYRPEDLDRLP